MPRNLNALLRYKQIDECLRNKYVDCTIARMQEKCSEHLGEHRGVYKKISERTIRDDIRVMRGDSLGFNAPIVVNNGVYSYSEEGYSISHRSIDDMNLLKDIMMMLLEEKDNISSPKLDTILDDLSYKTGIEVPRARKEAEQDQSFDRDVCASVSYCKSGPDEEYVKYSYLGRLIDKFRHYLKDSDIEDSIFESEEPSHLYSWREILEII